MSGDSLPVALEQQSRFIYPLRFMSTDWPQWQSALRSGTFQQATLWTPVILHGTEPEVTGSAEQRIADPEARYLSETRPWVKEMFLQNPEVHCWRLNPELADRWFAPRLQIFLNGDDFETWRGILDDRLPWPFSGEPTPEKRLKARHSCRRKTALAAIAKCPGIELFLSRSGAAALSITFTRENPSAPLEASDLKSFNYHLSHLKFRVPRLWKAETPQLPPDRLPALEGTPLERLGSDWAAFTLPELIGVLLGGLPKHEPLQSQLLIYTIVRYDKDAGLDDPAQAAAFHGLTLELAHVECNRPGFSPS